MKKRVACYDGLRGVAIASVFVWHLMFVYGSRNVSAYKFPSEFNDLFNLGQFGVSVFFLLSGNLICKSLERTASRKEFLVNRVSRIAVPYVCAVFCIVVILSYFGQKTFSIQQVLANLFFVQDVLPYGHIDGVFWTLVIEVKFYILVGLIGRKVLCYTRMLMLSLALLTFFVAFSSVYVHGLYYKLWASFSLLFMGLNIGVTRKIDLAVLLALVLVSVSFLMLPLNQYGSKIGYVTATLLAWLCFVLRYKFPIFKSKVLCMLGVISYSLYLYHQELSYLLLDTAIPKFGYLPALLSVVIIILLLSVLSYALIESKLASFVKRNMILWVLK